MTIRVAFPGSFDPLTIAHLAIAEAAHAHFGADAVDLVLSTIALTKEHGASVPLARRVAAITAHQVRLPWLGVRTTDDQLLVDIATGYDGLVVGADKWHQLHDVQFYGGSSLARDRAIARLPPLALAPRHGRSVPEDADAVWLPVSEEFHRVSSSAVRAGRHDWRA